MVVLLCFAGLDVARTDRYLSFYEDGANQSKLWDVLAIYTWLNLDIGYVQGYLLVYLLLFTRFNIL